MSGLGDSSVDSPPPAAFCRIAKVVVHLAILLTVFISIFVGLVPYVYVLGVNITIESVCYVAIVCLYIFSSSNWKKRIISGIFLGVLAIVIIIVAYNITASGVSTSYLLIFACNLVALLAYCVWRYWTPVVQAYQRHRRLVSGAAVSPAEAPPLSPEQQGEESGCSSPVQHATYRIEELPLPQKFSHDKLRDITGDFGDVVGRDGSAEVFRGVLDGTEVAVKRILGNMAVSKADFLREISVVANVHHRSLVRLRGYCLPRGGGDGGGYYLVYPFFKNGSLDRWLFSGEEKRRLLSWPMRRRIAVHVARALAYLHHECHRPILHLDIKPANILLDGELRAHLSDFGISMSITWDRTSVNTCGRGTPGYMAPEVWANALSAKSDVYSYGITLLELLAGRRCFEHCHGSAASSEEEEMPVDFFPSVVWKKMARGEVMEVADAAMERVDRGELEAVVKVALCCVQPRREMRPTMLTVVNMLEGRVAVDLPRTRASQPASRAKPRTHDDHQ